MARRKGPTKAAPSGKGVAKDSQKNPERAFDVWLDRGLHDMYDKIASEPVPDELLRLIEEDRKK